MLVAIHQPNYAPWIGYFVKMARADIFVLLDNVQYSKNSYINRVQIDAGGKARWLTVPVKYQFGDPINRVSVADAEWPLPHLDILKTYYSHAPAFDEVWSWLCDIYRGLPQENVAISNEALIEALAMRLSLVCKFRRASEFETGTATSDDRLIAILHALGSRASYLSGKGGANYQNAEKFEKAGISLIYSDFVHPAYDQGHDFLPGLSILDALFRLGFEGARDLVTEAAQTA